MKEFKKINNQFYCEECGGLFNKKEILSKHIKKHHSEIKPYFDKWLKEQNEGICKICGNETKFNNLKGYKIYCSTKCSTNDIIVREKIIKTNLKKYGVETPIKNKKIREKINNTNLEKYGSKTPFHNSEIQNKCKKTVLEKYNVKNSYLIQSIRKKALTNAHSENAENKRINTLIKNFGVDNAFKSQEIIQKIKQTNLKKYGVEFNSQNIKIHKKQQLGGFRAKQYKDTNLYYRGSYELDFLEKFYDKYPDIQNGPAIKYVYNNKNRIYFSDFYIPSLILVIVCKSTYYYNKFLELNKEKEKATIQLYNYKLILDKNGTI